MKVLLKKNIDKLGKRGEIIEVADGYARNYLFPKNMALKPTPQNMKQLDIEKRRFLQQEAEEKQQLEATAELLKNVSCTIVARADSDGHLYGSVTENKIVEALAENNVTVEARHIQLEQHIKQLGVYNIDVRLHSEVVCQIKLWVVGEDGETGPAPQEEETVEAADAEAEKSTEEK
jgi:large subunit ribosomal protein L9